MRERIEATPEQVGAFCRKWGIVRLEVFGSVLRDDFDPLCSDIDLLYSLAPDSPWGWEIVDMAEEAAQVFRRRVDLVSRAAVERSQNPVRRQAILAQTQPLYVAP